MLRLTLLLALFAPPQMAGAETVSGRAEALDGDTLDIGGRRIRLYGIDAPEKAQLCERKSGDWRCGRWSAGRLAELVAGRKVTCGGEERDRYGRLLARCDAGDGDIGAALVRMGAAVAYLRFSTGYADEEKEAIFAGAGIWEGGHQSPEEFRAALREAAPVTAPVTAPAGTDGCAIKGNVSASGRVYHLPGQENYADTRIDPARGERWFCSEAEARAAGWRRAKR